MPLDNAGNTLNAARNINLNSSTQTLQDWVGTSDINDFYRFTLAGRSSLQLSLNGLTNNANVELIQDKNKNGLVDTGDVISGSYKTGTQSESIQSTLDAGDYFVRVYAASRSNTNYNLNISAKLENIAPNSLNFQLDNTSLKATDSLSINSGWVYDANGANDIAKVDFQIKKAGGSLIDVADVINFSADSSDNTKDNFSYSLSLADLNLGAGDYSLQAVAYDKAGAGSNLVNQQFSIIPNPIAPNPPVSNDWFSQNLLDQQLITLVQNLASDGDLSRGDMLSIFRSVEDESKIDGNEIKDLKTLLGTSSPFSIQDPVKWLSKQVANGATQDMSAGDFESNLVGRWFLGTVAPTPVFNGQNLTYTKVQGTLFGSANEARIGDIRQGRLGDCTFLAALGATFGRQSNDAGNTSSSAINNMITDNGDNTYTVSFYTSTGFGVGSAQYVTVDNRIATSISASTNNGNGIWVALVEKAYAQWREWTVSQLGYNISGYNLIGDGASLSAPLEHITGRQARSIGSNDFSAIDAALASGKALSTTNGPHAYSVTNAYVNSNGQEIVVVRNPYGGFSDLSLADFSQTFGNGVTFA